MMGPPIYLTGASVFYAVSAAELPGHLSFLIRFSKETQKYDLPRCESSLGRHQFDDSRSFVFQLVAESGSR